MEPNSNALSGFKGFVQNLETKKSPLTANNGDVVGFCQEAT